MPTKKMIAELDRCAAWLKAQPHAVKTTDMAKIAPPEVKDPESWARRMMRKMDETGRAMADDVDSRSGGVWWVHPDADFRPPEEMAEVPTEEVNPSSGPTVESRQVRRARERREAKRATRPGAHLGSRFQHPENQLANLRGRV